MAKRGEVIRWPFNFGVEQTQRLGMLSVEATKALVRRQISLGYATLRVLDPLEFVAHRKREAESEENRQNELNKLAKDLRDRDPAHPEYPKLVRFSAQSMLKLVDQWATDGTPISKDGISQAERFLKENSVPSEIIAASLDQLQIEKPESLLRQRVAEPIVNVEVYSPS